MSIKIYDGLIIERDMTLKEAKALVTKIRPKVDEIIEREQTRLAARMAIMSHDRALMGLRDPEMEGSEAGVLSTWRSALSAGAHAIDQERKRDKAGERSMLPMSLEAVLMPAGPGETLALSYGAPVLQEEFVRASKAKEHGYWDNADPPEDVSRAQWARRKRDWQKVLGKTMRWSPAEAGMTLTLSSSQYKTWWSPEKETVLAAVSENPESSAASRAKMIARNELKMARLKALEAESKSPGSLSAFMRMEREIDKELASDEGTARVEALAAGLEPFLPALTMERLLMPLSQVEEQGAALRLALAEKEALSLAAEPAERAQKPRL